MRKIIECTLVSVDGVIGDPHLWAMQYFDQAAQDDALSLLSHSDAMLMGRRTYEIFFQLKAARTPTGSTTSVSTCSPQRCNGPSGRMRPLLEETSRPRLPS
jgi:dihydrofolate reductase